MVLLGTVFTVGLSFMDDMKGDGELCREAGLKASFMVFLVA